MVASTKIALWLMLLASLAMLVTCRTYRAKRQILYQDSNLNSQNETEALLPRRDNALKRLAKRPPPNPSSHLSSTKPAYPGDVASFLKLARQATPGIEPRNSSHSNGSEDGSAFPSFASGTNPRGGSGRYFPLASYDDLLASLDKSSSGGSVWFVPSQRNKRSAPSSSNAVRRSGAESHYTALPGFAPPSNSADTAERRSDVDAELTAEGAGFLLSDAIRGEPASDQDADAYSSAPLTESSNNQYSQLIPDAPQDDDAELTPRQQDQRKNESDSTNTVSGEEFLVGRLLERKPVQGPPSFPQANPLPYQQEPPQLPSGVDSSRNGIPQFPRKPVLLNPPGHVPPIPHPAMRPPPGPVSTHVMANIYTPSGGGVFPYSQATFHLPMYHMPVPASVPEVPARRRFIRSLTSSAEMLDTREVDDSHQPDDGAKEAAVSKAEETRLFPISGHFEDGGEFPFFGFDDGPPRPFAARRHSSSHQGPRGFQQHRGNPHSRRDRGPVYHASEVRRYASGMLGSGNFEIIKGGIYPEDEANRNHAGSNYVQSSSGLYDSPHPAGVYFDDGIFGGNPVLGFQGFSNFGSLYNTLSSVKRVSTASPSETELDPTNGQPGRSASQLIPMTEELQAVP